MKKYHVLQIMLNKKFGGVERIVLDLSLSLAERGHVVYFLCDPEFRKNTRIRHGNIKWIELPNFSRHDPFAKFKLKRFLKKTRIDVAHVHLRKGLSISKRVLNKHNIPVVTSLHNKINPKALKGVRLALVPSIKLLRHLSTFAPEVTPMLVPNFSRVEAISQDIVSLEPKSLLAYGRFVEKKGFHILIDAWRILKAESDSEITLTIVGDGPYKNTLVEKVDKLGLGNSIFIKPWCDNVIELLDSHDAFVLPSIDEPFGLVCLEAMARGKAIVATKSGGPSEIFNSGGAILVEPNSVSSLSKGIKKLLNNSEGNQDMANYSRALYLEKYSHSTVIKQIELIYKYVSNDYKSSD